MKRQVDEEVGNCICKVNYMAAIEVGRVCVKTAGNDAGEKVTITKVIDKNFVEIKKENGKTSRCSIRHLEPTAGVSKA